MEHHCGWHRRVEPQCVGRRGPFFQIIAGFWLPIQGFSQVVRQEKKVLKQLFVLRLLNLSFR